MAQFTAELTVPADQQDLLRAVQQDLLEWSPYSTFLQPKGGGVWGLLVLASTELDEEGLRTVAKQAGISPDAWRFDYELPD